MPKQTQMPDPRNQPTPKPPKGTTATPPIPREGGGNGPLAGKKGPKK